MDVLHLCRGLHRWGNIQILEVGVLHLEPVDAVLEQRREELVPRRRDVYLFEWVEAHGSSVLGSPLDGLCGCGDWRDFAEAGAASQ